RTVDAARPGDPTMAFSVRPDSPWITGSRPRHGSLRSPGRDGPVMTGKIENGDALTPGLFAGGFFFHAERIRESCFRKTGLERFLLAFMRRPARNPQHIEGRAQAPVGIGEAPGVYFRGAGDDPFRQRLAAPLNERIRRAHASQVLKQPES